MTHPRHELDEAFLTPVRLSLMAAVGDDTEFDFATLRDILDADDSAVSKAISHLEKIGYVKVTKGFVGSRPRTWVRSTAAGRAALRKHAAALTAIVGGSGGGASAE